MNNDISSTNTPASIKELLTDHNNSLISLRNRIENIRKDICGGCLPEKPILGSPDCMLDAVKENGIIINYIHDMITDIEQCLGIYE